MGLDVIGGVKMTKLQKILDERASQYGSFKENMEDLSKIVDEITIKTPSKRDINKIEEDSCNFIRYIMALKATRALNAHGEALKDCINDFINYFNLFKDNYPGFSINLTSNFNRIFLNTKGKWFFDDSQVDYIYREDSNKDTKTKDRFVELKKVITITIGTHFTYSNFLTIFLRGKYEEKAKNIYHRTDSPNKSIVHYIRLEEFKNFIENAKIMKERNYFSNSNKYDLVIKAFTKLVDEVNTYTTKDAPDYVIFPHQIKKLLEKGLIKQGYKKRKTYKNDDYYEN